MTSYFDNNGKLTRYEGISIGDTLIVNESGSHDGEHIDRGVEFIVDSFPPKITPHGTESGKDKNPRGGKRKFFVVGCTKGSKKKVRLFMYQICKPIKS